MQIWRGLRVIYFEKASGRACCLFSYMFTDFRLEKSRKQPYFDKDSAGMEDGEGRLRKGISGTL